MDFSKWNKAIDAEQYEKDLKEIKENGGGDYPEIEPGEYVVKIEKMELKASKKGDPMLSIQFRILEGEHKKACIFMNQVVLKPFQIYIANEFLNSLETDVEAAFHGDYKEYNDIILLPKLVTSWNFCLITARIPKVIRLSKLKRFTTLNNAILNGNSGGRSMRPPGKGT